MTTLLVVSALAARLIALPADSVPHCDTLFANLAQKLEANYAGYVLEVRDAEPRARADYERMKRLLGTKATRANGEQCYFALTALTDRFHDPHLFVYQQSYLDSTEVRRRVDARRGHEQRVDMSEEKARRYLERNASHLDPVEGIWRSGALRVAVVPEPRAPRGHFVGVVLASDSVTWKAGEVRARFTRRQDGAYDGETWDANLAHAFVIARVHRNVLLRFSPGMWAKEFPVRSADSGTVDLDEPHRATLVWRGTTPVLSIPSNDPTYRSALDSLFAAYHDTISKSERFVIDIRGNEGGASFVTNTIASMLRSAQQRKPAYLDGEPQMLSSEDQIAYARDRWQNIGPDSLSVNRLIARMIADPGALVPVTDSIDSVTDAAAQDSSKRAGAAAEPAGPMRVGILIDGGTVSAAETFLLKAMQSTRVQTFGEPTEGALDYQSVNIVRIGDTARRWYLGYPTVAASRTLPKGGMKGKGIAPDVRVDWRRVTDPIGYVDQRLRR